MVVPALTRRRSRRASSRISPYNSGNSSAANRQASGGAPRPSARVIEESGMGVTDDDLKVTRSVAPAQPSASTSHSNRTTTGCRDSDVGIKASRASTFNYVYSALARRKPAVDSRLGCGTAPADRWTSVNRTSFVVLARFSASLEVTTLPCVLSVRFRAADVLLEVKARTWVFSCSI